MRSMAMAVIALSASCQLETQQRIDTGPPKDMKGFNNWFATASPEEKEKYYHDISPNYIEKHGEDANNVRLCYHLDQKWKGLDNWVDQRWREAGVRFLDDQKYTDWIVN